MVNAVLLQQRAVVKLPKIRQGDRRKNIIHLSRLRYPAKKQSELDFKRYDGG
jgi:hypothetical protein